MSWTCPDCRGEFPDPREIGSAQFCPWCGLQVDGGFDPREELRTVRHVVGDGESEVRQDSPVRRLLG